MGAPAMASHWIVDIIETRSGDVKGMRRGKFRQERRKEGEFLISDF